MDIAKYIDKKRSLEFRKSIPEIRRQLAFTLFENHGDDFGIGGNTFRAFVNLKHKPSELYREWATARCQKFTVDYLSKALESQESFFKWHRDLEKSLQAYWVSFEKHELSFAHQQKVVDLFLKWLSRHDFSSQKISSGFEKFANCALDRQSLAKLNECYSYALPMTNPRMGDVHGPQTYLFVQEMITAFASQNGGSRLLFDFFSWKKGG